MWLIKEPCDAICYKAGIWKALEIKVATNKRGEARMRKDQVKQNSFCELTGTPRVTSAESALKALKT